MGLRAAPSALQQLAQVADEALAILLREGRVLVSLDLAALASGLATLGLLGVAHHHERVDGALVVELPAHADGLGTAPERHGGEAHVLRHHEVVLLELADDGEVCGVAALLHLQDADPEAVTGVHRVALAHVLCQVVAIVAADDAGYVRAARAVDGLARDGAGVGVNVERGHVVSSRAWVGAAS